MPLLHPDRAAVTVGCAVLTVRDTRTFATDKSGQLLQAKLTAAPHPVLAYALWPDEPEVVGRPVQTSVTNDSMAVMVLNGGTGIAPRDTTSEVVAALLSKTLPGFGEIFRQLSYAEIGSRAMASRAISGVCESTLIFSLPGSSKAVALAMDKLILPELVHLTTQLRG
ncbi:MAG: MogA/MoaB family molybdenum cofactor biosynthesis protein [Cyanobacteria bacterium P01_D01_bin.115]